jgi:hypothetical protein
MKEEKKDNAVIAENQEDMSKPGTALIVGSLKKFDIDYPITDLLRGYTEKKERFFTVLLNQ